MRASVETATPGLPFVSDVHSNKVVKEIPAPEPKKEELYTSASSMRTQVTIATNASKRSEVAHH